MSPVSMTKGVVAAGHHATAAAAREVLSAGGNAFDAVIAALAASCVAEPVLASLGGGGFLLAHHQGQELLYDFFSHTPQRKRPVEELEFYPIHADFGTTTQEFHIGKGAIAVPGVIKGIDLIHKELATMPLSELFAPAIRLARDGIEVDRFQADVFRIISPILLATPEARRLFTPESSQQLAQVGDSLHFTEMANLFEALAREGSDLFYTGELAHQISRDLAESSHLTIEDFAAYQVIKRKPLYIDYHQHRIATNPFPSAGGILINVALKLFESLPCPTDQNSTGTFLSQMAITQQLTNQWRNQHAPFDVNSLKLMDLQPYQTQLAQRATFSRGTTHMSVVDSAGNMASLTLSNGEGCGYVVPDTGMMLNNMLGEEDLNEGSFHNWPCNERLSSMMAPSFISQQDGLHYAIGSGGSNRIRTAVLQVIINLLDLGMPLEQAIQQPRLHLERQLDIEPGHSEAALAHLKRSFDAMTVWPAQNLFFGGVHGVAIDPDTGTMHGYGDQRRSGVCLAAD